MWRLGDSYQDSSRLAAVVARWVWGLEDESVATSMTLSRLPLLRSEYPSIDHMYSSSLQTIRRGLSASARL